MTGLGLNHSICISLIFEILNSHLLYDLVSSPANLTETSKINCLDTSTKWAREPPQRGQVCLPQSFRRSSLRFPPADSKTPRLTPISFQIYSANSGRLHQMLSTKYYLAIQANPLWIMIILWCPLLGLAECQQEIIHPYEWSLPKTTDLNHQHCKRRHVQTVPHQLLQPHHLHYMEILITNHYIHIGLYLRSLLTK